MTFFFVFAAISAVAATYTPVELNAALAAAQAPPLQCGVLTDVLFSESVCACNSVDHVGHCPSDEPRRLYLKEGNGSLDLRSATKLESLSIRDWAALPTLDLTGLTRLTYLSIELRASPLRDEAFNAQHLDAIVGLQSICRSGKLRTLVIKFVGLRELDLTGCAELESLELFGLMRLSRFAIGGTTSLAVAEVANTFAAEDSVRQQLQAHPNLFWLQLTENSYTPSAAVIDGWRGYVCRSPRVRRAGSLCNLGRICYFNAGSCGVCAAEARSACATGRFCPPPTMAASRCTKGVDFDIAFELFNGATPSTDDHVCIKFAQSIHGKVKPADGADCRVAQIESSVKALAALQGSNFACTFRFSDDNTRVVSFELTGAAQLRLGTTGFECGARLSLVGATTFVGNTTTFAGRATGTGTASALALEDMTLAGDALATPTPTADSLNRAAIGLAVVLVAVLVVWVISCAVLTLRLRRARDAAAAAQAAPPAAPSVTREAESAPSSRRQRRRRSNRRA